jgi:hypothetical protein
MRTSAIVTAALAGFAALAVAHPGPASAAPIIQVKGRPAIQLGPVHRVAEGVEIAGTVVELVGGDPLPFVVIEVALDGESEFTQTDETGRFRMVRRVDDGAHRLTIGVEGDDQLAEATVEVERFDIQRRPLALAVSARQPDATAVKISVQATGDQPTGGLAIEVRAGPTDGAAPTPVGTITTDPRGEGELAIPMTALGGPGSKLFEVAFAGDAVWDAARATTVATIESKTTLELELADDAIRHEGRLRARGRLLDADGKGLAALPVVVRGKGRVLTDLLTAPDGGFELSIAASEIGPGPLTVQASFEPKSGWLGASRSPIRAATIEERRPVPLRLTFGALAATAAALLAFVALRTRPWERWSHAPAPEASTPSAASVPSEGLAPARPSLKHALFRPGDHGFAGRVVSRPTGRPLVGAALIVGERHAVSDAAGRFGFEDLPAGDHAVVVTASGHVSLRFSITLPHRGELRDARVDIVEVRERMFASYRTVAEPLMPEPGAWGLFTPRQIVDAVRARRPAPALAELTDYIEEKYFSARVPDEGELGEASRRVAAAGAEGDPGQDASRGAGPLT